MLPPSSQREVSLGHKTGIIFDGMDNAIFSQRQEVGYVSLCFPLDGTQDGYPSEYDTDPSKHLSKWVFTIIRVLAGFWGYTTLLSLTVTLLDDGLPAYRFSFYPGMIHWRKNYWHV